MNIEQAIKIAKTPEPVTCGECNEELFSPMDKLSVSLYGKCSVHFEDDSHQEKNLLKLSEVL